MSKEYYKSKIAARREDIVGLRAKIVKVKDDKKRRMESLAKSIKNTTSKTSKESYRKQKISDSAKFDREVDSLKKKIDGVKKEVENFKSTLARLK